VPKTKPPAVFVKLAKMRNAVVDGNFQIDVTEGLLEQLQSTTMTSQPNAKNVKAACARPFA
jgi:hypothetical protein